MIAATQLHPDIRRAALSAELVFWAKRYAAQGLPVFPAAVIDGRKRPLVKIGRGDDHGSLASTEFEQIEIWWTRWPLAMIGMPTGGPSRICVLDVDVKNGVDGFQTMRDSEWTLPSESIEVKTPSGGSHFYFQMPEDEDVRSSAGIIGPGLDLRANGGMIILPPSRAHLDAPDYHYAEGQECSAGVLIW